MERILNACVSGNYIMTNEIRNAFVRGENVPATIDFIIHDNSLPEYCYLMYQRKGDKSPYIVSLTKTVEGEFTKLAYSPTVHFCAKAGVVAIQLVACEIEDPSEVADSDESALVKLTEIATVEIADSLVDPENPKPLESIFTEYLTQFEDLLAQTQDSEGKAEGYANDAKGYAEQAEQALSGLTERVALLEIPAEITNSEIDDIFNTEA